MYQSHSQFSNLSFDQQYHNVGISIREKRQGAQNPSLIIHQAINASSLLTAGQTNNSYLFISGRHNLTNICSTQWTRISLFFVFPSIDLSGSSLELVCIWHLHYPRSRTHSTFSKPVFGANNFVYWKFWLPAKVDKYHCNNNDLLQWSFH